MWNQDTSSKRTSDQWKALNDKQITVKKLTREMNLNNLSPTDVRIVHGTHLYLDIKNFRDVVGNATLRRDDFVSVQRTTSFLVCCDGASFRHERSESNTAALATED